MFGRGSALTRDGRGSGPTSLERALLALTVLGFLVPNAMVAIFMVEHDFDPSAYFSLWVDSLPAAQLAVDLGIVFVAFALWSTWEGRRLGLRVWWVIPASLLVGLCFAFPLFLLVRERAVRGEAARQSQAQAAVGP